MPRHNRENTPPEKRRAPKGSLVGRASVSHTAESLGHLEALKAAWCMSESEVLREALRLAAREFGR